MPKFLIEVPHGSDKASCARAILTFLQTGSHFLVNADWGCPDGEHKVWLILEVESREDARNVLPPSYRADAKIVQLTKYTMQDFKEATDQHPG
jgi:hypothetical protein